VLNNVNLQNLFLINGVSRSGNHCIIEWIQSHCQPCFFINNIHLEESNENFIQSKHRRKFYAGEYKRFAEENEEKRSLVFSYENRHIKNWSKLKYNLSPRRMYRVIIIRDFYNLMASVCKRFITKYNDDHERVSMRIPQHKKAWINHARHVLSSDDYIVIYYDKWVIDKDYRAEIAKTFNQTLNDTTINSVANFNGGSSFDHLHHLNQAQDMNVLNRYETIKDHPVVKHFCNNKRCRRFNNALREKFGMDM